jgi:cellulose synthase/poly-beta-1,6-N-acetylglucosamine synthase-like glycosyltransferase
LQEHSSELGLINENFTQKSSFLLPLNLSNKSSNYTDTATLNLNKNYKIIYDNQKNENNNLKKFAFSLIIPVYQEEKIIEKELVKFTNELRAKYNFEIVVTDGGSTDKTLEIAQKYADILITNSTNQKQTIAEGRNFGAEVANSDNFVFLNIDSTPQNLDHFLQTISLWTKDKSNLKAK